MTKINLGNKSAMKRLRMNTAGEFKTGENLNFAEKVQFTVVVRRFKLANIRPSISPLLFNDFNTKHVDSLTLMSK